MSALGGLLSRGITALGGPQVAAVIVVGGVAVGAIGGGAIAAGALGGKPGGSASTGSVPIYPCPNQGPALLTVAGGQQLLVTGRLADGSWLRIHLPEPGRSEGWIQATPLTVSGSIDSLPVATCGSEALIAAPAVIAMPSLTAIVNATPTPAPTPAPTAEPTATPTTGPTPPPNGPPTLKGLVVSTSKISFDTGAYCPTAVKHVQFSVNAADATGVTGVMLFWRAPGAASYAQAPMTLNGGVATSGTWQVTLDTTANSITKAGSLAYYAVGTNTGGLTSRVPASGAQAITVAVCANTGPSITQASSAGGSTLYWDPLGVGCTPSTSNMTAVVSDQDGVSSVTLFFRRPGSSTWSSKPMDNTTIPGKWYANLDTLGDKITIPTPPTGTLSWYIRAIDGKGLASQTRAASITIKRCDSPAQFFVNGLGTTFYTYCTGNPNYTPWVNIVWSFSITDPDGLVRASLSYVVTNLQTQLQTSNTVATAVGFQRFGMQSANIDGNTYFGQNLVTWTITTTDQYGGKSSQGGKGTVTFSPC